MKVLILRVADTCLMEGKIEEKGIHVLPSFHDGWNFNFNKHSKMINSETYVLLVDIEPKVIQGCMILRMTKDDPYMAFLEVAPVNFGKRKRYDYIAGCLIAYACRLSHKYGKGHNQGYVTFMVSEQNQIMKEKLMSIYSRKYKAQQIENTNYMFIEPKDGQSLIEEYLKRKSL